MQKNAAVFANTQVNLRAVLLTIFGAVFMFLLTILSARAVEDLISWISIIPSLIPSLFILVVFACLYELLTLKKYVVATKQLTCSYIVFPFTQAFQLIDLAELGQEPYQVGNPQQGVIHQGHQCRLVFEGGKIILFNSCYTHNYYSFTAALIKASVRSNATVDRKKLQQVYQQLKNSEYKNRYTPAHLSFWPCFFALICVLLLCSLLNGAY